MPFSGRQKIAGSVVLGSLLVAAAVALNIGWIVLNWREGLLLILGVVFFLVIIAGGVLNTIFLVREVRRNEQHDTFINAVTHELKTPVASIRLYLETLQRHDDLAPDKRREFYKVMLEDSDRLQRLVEQVLLAARSPRQRLLHRAPVDMRALLQECVQVSRARHRLDAEALAFEDLTAAGFDATVLGDPDELRAAVLNLADNAVQYSPESVRVTVQLAPADDARLAVRVSDRGLGLSPADLKPIFRRFHRIPEAVAMRLKGTGLGLFIVSSVARKHGGRVFAESPGPGHGSTFTLHLPLARQA